jgi:N-ethylmaleimide reductase
MLTESASISQRGMGFPGQGNIYNKEQAQGWKKVLKRVHDKGSVLFAQIYHAGRVTHPSFNGGLESWAPSAVQNRQTIPNLGNASYPTPKEITHEDIKTLKSEYENSFVLAKEAGFDGIQFHGATGYLIDEFLRSHTNRRTD